MKLIVIGDRVKVARPENPKHPRKGRIGRVVLAREFAEVRDPEGELRHAACTLCWVAFDDPPGSPLSGIRSPLLGHELEVVRG